MICVLTFTDIQNVGVMRMCGIFGGVSPQTLDVNILSKIAKLAARRGRDASGYIEYTSEKYKVIRSDFQISETLNLAPITHSPFVAGHSRLITNGFLDNQPVRYADFFVIHNGIVLNANQIWDEIRLERKLEVDSEVIAALAHHLHSFGCAIEDLPDQILSKCEGVVSAAIVMPDLGKLLLLSNNGSLFVGKIGKDTYFASEKFSLTDVGCQSVEQIEKSLILDIPASPIIIENRLENSRINLIPPLRSPNNESDLLKYSNLNLSRCSKCVLPSSMPFIYFDETGVCNFCLNYSKRNQPKPLEQLEVILAKYKKKDGPDCIFPFSGGRDSSFGLHLAVKELGLKPIAYTYDWGMVTDLGRRNMSRMCGELGIENIVVAADINWKRANIRKNLLAWLKSPNLGMLSILTAGDKHFFRHIEDVKRETGISLNLWSVNPLEVTHFKAGFLGVPPDFESERVYQSGLRKQLEYQQLRFRAMLKSPGYFNSSIIDTVTGEYYRSRKNKKDYFHLVDFWRWDEEEIDNTLDTYGWERAIDTTSTWRIGDGTAAFYNYVYHRVAGFSEHDTFRSNQIREGDISREEALRLIDLENLPRYENIKWYLDVLGLDFCEVIEKVNAIPRVAEI